MASCTLCASLKVNRSRIRFTTRDNAESHANQHLLQMKFFYKDCITLDQVFAQCFPNFAVPSIIKMKKSVRKAGHRSLLNLCHILVNGRISKATPRAICQKCGTGIVLYDKSGQRNRLAIDHASVHLGIDLFECRKCGRLFRSRNAVFHHLLTFHRLRSLTEYYTDKCGDFDDEVSASIKECFYKDNVPTGKKAHNISLRDETQVRSKTMGSKMADERHLLCYHLIRQLAGGDGKIQCRLCPMRISVRHGKGYQGKCAMNHALVHLKKPLFRCKVCSDCRHSSGSMQSHLQSAHALPLSNNYDCTADELHSEIMNMLRKCYADESGSK